MKYFGQKSLSSLLFKFLNIMFYLLIVGFILVLLFIFIFNYRNPESGNVYYSIDLGGMDLTTEYKAPILPALFLIPILLFCILLFLIDRLRAFFGNLQNDKIFIEQNFLLLQQTSWLLILSGIIKSISNYVLWNHFLSIANPDTQSAVVSFSLSDPWEIVSQEALFGSIEMRYTLISEPGLIISGAALLFISHLFRVALSLQQENDLTI